MLPSIYLITDRNQAAGRNLPAVVADALVGGVRMIQLREKDLSSRQLFELAVELRALTASYRAKLIINDRIDIALASDADGVHLGVGSIPVNHAKKLLGVEKLVGYSSHSVHEAIQAELDGADFVTFGPVFDTPSKRAYGKPLGIEQLHLAATTLSIPVYALGGIKLPNLPDVIATGCAGVALISAIISAESPQNASRELLSNMVRN